MYSRRHLLAITAGLPWAACRREKNPGLRAYAFVANQEGKALAVADLSAFAVTRHIRLDDQPTAVAAPAASPFVFALTPGSGTLHRISVEQLQFQAKLRVAPSAWNMRLSPDQKFLYVLCAQQRKLVRVALDRFAIDQEIALPGVPSDFDLASYLPYAAVSFGTEGRFALIDLGARRAGPVKDLGSEVGAVRFQTNGRALLVANRGARTLEAYQTASGRKIVELPLSLRPDQLCFSADGGQLFVTGEGSDAVCVVYPYHTPQVAETVLAGRQPGAMAASADPAFLFVTNPSSGQVSILNIRDRKVIAAVGVGAEPGHIVVTPDSQYALVLNQKSGDMAVLRVDRITRNRQKSASLFTMIPVGSKPVAAAVRMI
jgi:YVTN family beta-propeller protein